LSFLLLPCAKLIYSDMATLVKVSGSRKGRKVSAAKVWRVLKQVLSEQEFRAFMASIPKELHIQALTSGDPEDFFGRYLLGTQLEAYLTAPFYRRRRILAQVIAQALEAAGVAVPEKIRKAATAGEGRRGPRGPRGESRLTRYQALLEQTHQLLQDPSCTHIHQYLAEVEAVLNYQIQKLVDLQNYIKARKEKKTQE